MTYDEIIEVVNAVKERKQIEIRCKYGEDRRWTLLGDPTCYDLNFAAFEFRVKREPVVRWGIEKSDGEFISTSRSKKEAETRSKLWGEDCRVFKMVEVEE